MYIRDVSKWTSLGDAEVFGKSDNSPVTIADYASQCLVTEYLSVATGGVKTSHYNSY